MNKQSTVRAVVKTIRIEPEDPHPLGAQDCNLLRQLREALPGKAVHFRLACGAPTSVSPLYYLDMRVLAPVSVSPLAPQG